MRFADIAVNLTDPMFQGVYHGSEKHPPDLPAIIGRAKQAGVERILITGTSLSESREALKLANEYDLHCTAGVHPTSTNEIEKHPQGTEGYLSDLRTLIEQDRGEGGSKRIISIGEVGLDYDRLRFSSKEVQLRHLPNLLRLSQTYKLPLFLHSRTSDAHVDLIRMLKEVGFDSAWPGGVVHSFTGSAKEADELVSHGLYIGINGCSLKTDENLEVVKRIPLSSLMLETDAPWCSITNSHASSKYLDADGPVKKVSKAQAWKEGMGVKGRMEPAEVVTIAGIVAKVKAVTVEEVAEAAWTNTMRLFYPGHVDT